jgi:hypothetical protein
MGDLQPYGFVLSCKNKSNIKNINNMSIIIFPFSGRVCLSVHCVFSALLTLNTAAILHKQIAGANYMLKFVTYLQSTADGSKQS